MDTPEAPFVPISTTAPPTESGQPVSQVSKFDRAAVRREMAEKGFFTLPTGTNVLLDVTVAPKLDKHNMQGRRLGIGTSQAPIECSVSVSGEALNPEDPDTTWASLSLTSTELRRLQGDTAQLDAELEALLPKSDERETLSTLISRSGNPM